MTEDKRLVEVEMSAVEDISKLIRKAKFCIDECPVPVKNVLLGCTCRPVKYMKECSRLKQYERRKKNGRTTEKSN